MFSLTLLLCPLAPATEPRAIDSKFAQIAPVCQDESGLRRSPEQTRAVILVQGLYPRPFRNDRVAQADWQSWQKPGSVLVEALAKDSDVFAFAYGQSRAVEELADAVMLVQRVVRLKQLGYQEIVLIGHSAGGLLARHLVEDHPDAGVTKVIQVCTPNGGTDWGKFTLGVRKDQEAFVASLSREGRRQCLQCRQEKTIPEQTEFVCLVGHLVVQAKLELGIGLAARLNERGDGVVASHCQWSEDLRGQGIPAVTLRADHESVVRNNEHVAAIAKLVRDQQPRWDPAKVAAERIRILGE